MDTRETDDRAAAISEGEGPRTGLVILFAADAPELHGAWLPLGPRGETATLGRGGGDTTSKYPRLLPVRQRPATTERLPALLDPFLSQEQLHITERDAGITITNVGKRELLDSMGRARTELTLAAGEIAEVRGRLLLLASRRPTELPPARSLPKAYHPFGEADADGLVGESPAAWRLRDVVAFIAARTQHVLLLGESGTGKEIIANAVHRLSARKGRRIVSRNAATLPAGLIDAELFGHVANYPNMGMPERTGLVAEADGSTLFLDEIGELSHGLSTKLLRVLDERGEYQRLGDSRIRTSNFRLIGATNRPFEALKEDMAARFKLRVLVPTLAARREDIPLLARYLLRHAAVRDPVIGERFFEGWNGHSGEPRISIELIKRLTTHDYRTHVRELDVLLWASLGSSPAGVAELTPEVESSMHGAAPDGDGDGEVPRVDVRTVTAEDITKAIERAGGVHEKAWRDLGFANRHVLKRLMRKHRLS